MSHIDTDCYPSSFKMHLQDRTVVPLSIIWQEINLKYCREKCNKNEQPQWAVWCRSAGDRLHTSTTSCNYNTSPIIQTVGVFCAETKQWGALWALQKYNCYARILEVRRTSSKWRCHFDNVQSCVLNQAWHLIIISMQNVFLLLPKHDVLRSSHAERVSVNSSILKLISQIDSSSPPSH